MRQHGEVGTRKHRGVHRRRLIQRQGTATLLSLDRFIPWHSTARVIVPIALCVWLCLGMRGADAAGAELSSSPHHTTSEASHQCRCKSCRGGNSCCCVPSATKSRQPDESSDSSSPAPGARLESGPCWNGLPCGGTPILPSPAARLAAHEAASLLGALLVFPPRTSPLAKAFDSALQSALLADRLDDPPESRLPVWY